MARGKADIKTRLKRQEAKIIKMTEAFLKSKRSVDEVMDFLKGKADL